MKSLLGSHFASSVAGGAVVAIVFLVLGVTGHRTVQTVVQESPMSGQTHSGKGASLTPNAIYERDAPGVVFVRAQIVQQVRDPFQLYPTQRQSVSTGSGFLIDPRGYILTNYHLIEGAERAEGVTVQFEDDVARSAEIVGEDPNNDLAVLKVNMGGVSPIQPLVLGDSTTVRVGDPTLAIGNPFGLDRTLTSGIVSALQREIQAPNKFQIDNVIQTDAPINPGNSGGPLLDGTGRVIGINSQIETGGGEGSVGIAFAVPINTAKALLPQLEQGTTVRIASLGINGEPTPGSRPGVVVESAPAGGPAAAAGVRKGDDIEQVAGREVSSMTQVQQVVEAHVPGQSIPVLIRRGRQSSVIRVQLASRPAQAP